MNALRRLLEACVAFAVCNIALTTYMAMAAGAPEMAAARDWSGMATFIAAVFVGIGSLVGSIGALVISWRSSTKIVAVAEQVKKVELNTNSMSERLERQAELAGAARGKDEQIAVTAQVDAARAEGQASVVAPAGPTPVTVVNSAPVKVTETKPK